MVSILPRVDLTENTEMEWFCILPLFRLDTLNYTTDAQSRILYMVISVLASSDQYRYCHLGQAMISLDVFLFILAQ